MREGRAPCRVVGEGDDRLRQAGRILRLDETDHFVGEVGLDRTRASDDRGCPSTAYSMSFVGRMPSVNDVTADRDDPDVGATDDAGQVAGRNECSAQVDHLAKISSAIRASTVGRYSPRP